MAGLVSCHAVEHPDAGPRANSGRPAPSFASFGAAAMASAGVTISAGHAFQPFSRAHTTQPRPRPAAGPAAPAAAPPPADAARSAAARSRSELPSGSARRAKRLGLKRACPVASGRTPLEHKRAQLHMCCYVRIKKSLQEAGDGCCTERSCQCCVLPTPLCMRGSACSRA